MPWYAWVLVAWFVANAITKVALIDRVVMVERTEAIAGLVAYGLLIWAVVALAGAA